MRTVSRFKSFLSPLFVQHQHSNRSCSTLVTNLDLCLSTHTADRLLTVSHHHFGRHKQHYHSKMESSPFTVSTVLIDVIMIQE